MKPSAVVQFAEAMRAMNGPLAEAAEAVRRVTEAMKPDKVYVIDPDVIRGIERVTGEEYDPETDTWDQPQLGVSFPDDTNWGTTVDEYPKEEPDDGRTD